MQLLENPTAEALASYSLTKLRIEIVGSNFPRLKKLNVRRTSNQDLCSPSMCVMMLLDSRMGISQFRNHKQYSVECSYIRPLMKYWRAMPPALSFYQGEKKGFWGRIPQEILKSHTLYFGYKCIQLPFLCHKGTTIVIRK